MGIVTILFLLAAAITVGLILWGVGVYNGLVRLRQHCEEAWSDISVQMKRRYNLVPNLVETVKGYASHEQETLEKVIQARNMAMANDGSVASQGKTEGMFAGALKSLFALSEAYPDLKANQGFRDLQAELSQIEDHIQKARRYYNGNVRELNTKVETFPNNLIAGSFNFVKRDYFELEDEAAREPVKVQF